MSGGGGVNRALPALERPVEPEPVWHAVPGDEALEDLGSRSTGLSEEEARRRVEEFGPNVLQHDDGPSPLRILWEQFRSPMLYVLIGSGLLALAMGKTIDGLVILGVVVVNALIGFVQEYRAGRAIRALMDMVPQTASVLRSGQRRSVEAAELAPGDIVLLEPGDRVPADLRLLSLRSLRVDEATLTGESMPVGKSLDVLAPETVLADRRNLAFGGTLVVSGSATGVVYTTGSGTELGRISTMIRDVEPLETPLARQLGAVGRWLAIAIMAVAGLLLVIGLGRGFPLVDALLVAVTLAVAAIPEGLPAVVTIALAIGVQRMARRRAVIRRLPAAETLGGTTVICTDKTGTLTRNEMTVKVVRTPTATYEVEGVGYEPEGRFRQTAGVTGSADRELEALLTAGVLASDADVEASDGGWRVVGDPTEGALLVAARKAGLEAPALREARPRLDAIPFESERRFMATLSGGRGTPGCTVCAKGAPEVLLPRCRDTDGLDRAKILALVDELAGRGMRVLALAHRELGFERRHLEDTEVRDLTFLGVVGMIDPPRPEAIAAIEECQEAGIVVKMITGDHRATAAAIGRQLGLAAEGERGVTGAELDRLDADEIEEVAERENVFARVAPEHKLALVRALQRRGHVVAMTGDGVNDSPALKQANIGVAMGITGTAASQEAAAIVLADDNFATITAAVEEGRRVYDNLLKSLAFILPTNLGLALILLSAVVAFPITVGNPLLPMTPTQTLWINLIAAVSLALPLAFEAMEPNVMRRPPRRPEKRLLGGFVVFRSVLVAVLMAAGALGLFLYEYDLQIGRGRPVATALQEAQTMAVTTVVLFQVFYLLNCRSLKDSVFRIGFFSNPSIFVGIGVLLVLQLAFVYAPFMNDIFGTAPLDADALIKSILVGLSVLPVITIEKRLRRLRSPTPPRRG